MASQHLSSHSGTGPAPDVSSPSVSIPITQPALEKFKHNYVRGVLSKIMIKFEVKPTAQLPDLSDEHRATLTAFLDCLGHFTGMTPEIANGSGVKHILQSMKGDNIKGKRFLLPDPFPRLSREIWDRLERENWGARDDAAANQAGQQQPPQNLATSILPNHIFNAPARRTNPDAVARYRARPDHPIYGTNGIMHHIICYTGRKLTHKISPAWRGRDADAHGHNGIVVGQWWPRQLCAVRDGAHGKTMAGIYGTEEKGVFSVVVGGAYAGLDRDLGDRIWYSGSKADDNVDPVHPDVTSDTRALEMAQQRRQHVRVLRSSKGESALSPSVGLRYDGLYTVTERSVGRNSVGGAYLKFLLVRCPGQLPIQRDRPTLAEKRAFARVNRGYN